MRRRRDEAAGAVPAFEQWESRDPLLIAPCRAGRRAHHRCCCTSVLRFFPDHRLSNSGDALVGAPGAAVVCRLHRAPLVRCTTPHLPCLAQVGRVEPLRSDGRWRCATARPPGTRTLHHCVLRRAIGIRSSCTTSRRTSSAAFGRSAARRTSRASTDPLRSTSAESPLPTRLRACASSRRTGWRRHAVGVRIGVG